MINKTVILIGSEGKIGEAIRDNLTEKGIDVIGTKIDQINLKDPFYQRFLEEYICRYETEDFSEFSVVYNAGVDRLDWIKHQDWSDIEECFNVNTFGLMRALRGFSKNALAKRFVHICSISATVPQTCTLAYNSSKAAARMASFTTARELAPLGKYVNVVSPGPVADTAMTDYVIHRVPDLRGWSFEEAEEKQMSVVPLRRRIVPEEVANAVAFLLDGELSGAFVGAELRVSGGL